MARKDEILKNFLNNEILKSKYEVEKSKIPSTVREALFSDEPIIKAIALIVDGLENSIPITDNALRNQVIQFLNEAI